MHAIKQGVSPGVLARFLVLGLPGGVMMAADAASFDVTTVMASVLGNPPSPAPFSLSQLLSAVNWNPCLTFMTSIRHICAQWLLVSETVWDTQNDSYPRYLILVSLLDSQYFLVLL